MGTFWSAKLIAKHLGTSEETDRSCVGVGH